MRLKKNFGLYIYISIYICCLVKCYTTKSNFENLILLFTVHLKNCNTFRCLDKN